MSEEIIKTEAETVEDAKSSALKVVQEEEKVLLFTLNKEGQMRSVYFGIHHDEVIGMLFGAMQHIGSPSWSEVVNELAHLRAENVQLKSVITKAEDVKDGV